jgi:RecG-like helicase
MSTMDLPNTLTPLQITKLSENGITTLYQLITYLPYRVSYIKPLGQLIDHNDSTSQYLATGTIIDYTIMGGQRAKIRISIETQEMGRLIAYSFVPIRFLITTLKEPGIKYIVLSKSGDFWTVESIRKTNLLADTDLLVIPHYHKLGKLNSAFLRSVFDRLHSSSFVLNLTGLVPASLNIPTALSLLPLHRPDNLKLYTQTLQDYRIFEAFLSLATIRYFGLSQQNAIGKESHISDTIVERVIVSHPYQLSVSQQKLIRYYTKLLTV